MDRDVIFLNQEKKQCEAWIVRASFFPFIYCIFIYCYLFRSSLTNLGKCAITLLKYKSTFPLSKHICMHRIINYTIKHLCSLLKRKKIKVSVFV